MKKVLFIINPKSGMDRVKAIQKSIEQNLDKNLFFYKITYTEYPQHGTILARKAVESNTDIIVAVGGDGSVNDIVRGMYHSNSILAIIPKGSGNGLARSLDIPLEIDKAIQVINQCHDICIDLGLANGELFCSNAGVGFDALVAAEFKKSKRRGFIAYSWIITKFLWKYKISKYSYEIDGKPGKAALFMMNVANAIQLGYGFKIAPYADLKDGFFDVILIHKFPKLFAFLIAVRAFKGAILKSKFIEHFSAKEINIFNENLSIFQFDGEAHFCKKELHIKMLPKSLNVLVASK